MSGIEGSAGSPAEARGSIAGTSVGSREVERDPASRANGRGELPRLPVPAAIPPAETLERSRPALRRFHLAGADATPLPAPGERRGLEPAILRSMLDAAGRGRHYPLAILDGEAGREIAPLAEVLDRALERASAGG